MGLTRFGHLWQGLLRHVFLSVLHTTAWLRLSDTNTKNACCFSAGKNKIKYLSPLTQHGGVLKPFPVLENVSRSRSSAWQEHLGYPRAKPPVRAPKQSKADMTNTPMGKHRAKNSHGQGSSLGWWLRKSCWHSLNGENVRLGYKSCPPALTGLWSGLVVFLLAFLHLPDFQGFSFIWLGMVSIKAKTGEIRGHPRQPAPCCLSISMSACLSVSLSVSFFFFNENLERKHGKLLPA